MRRPSPFTGGTHSPPVSLCRQDTPLSSFPSLLPSSSPTLVFSNSGDGRRGHGDPGKSGGAAVGSGGAGSRVSPGSTAHDMYRSASVPGKKQTSKA
jgi:hypothetical protein